MLLLCFVSFSALCALISSVFYSVTLALNYGREIQIKLLFITCGLIFYPSLIVVSVVVLCISILCIVLLIRKKCTKPNSALTIISVVSTLISFVLMVDVLQFRIVTIPLKIDRTEANIHWDPVFQPYEDGALATWYEDGF